MNKPFTAVATLALAVGLATGMTAAAPPPSATPAAACNITWGSNAKGNPTMNGAQVIGVRTGQHECFDRLVIDMRYKLKGYDVRYAPVYQEGSGDPVPLAGRADIRIIVRGPAYNMSGHPTYNPPDWDHAVKLDGHRTFRQVAFAGSFEGQSTFGLGVRAKLPFRVQIMDGPGKNSRLVIDVAHQW
jgi:hypothetical protein